MNDLIPNKEPNMDDMKKSISSAGGLFYQYRPCRRDASTIYDIENIRHGIVYAQTPLNMNDPFDSMIGFSAEKIYENCISMLTDALDVDDNLKAIISVFLQYRAFGKIAELISYTKELKHYLITRRTIMHHTSIPFNTFVIQNSKVLYSKIPKMLKSIFTYTAFIAFSLIVGELGTVEISEKSISELLKMDDMLDELHAKAEEVRDAIYVPQLQKFLSQLTVSCFSASGWNNQLMWSHYSNSYSGICVEYDFNKIKDFIGFIYPVNYTSIRPTLSMSDLGIGGFSLTGNDKIIHCEMDVTNLFSYMLCKNTCWNYEDEWRIINIGKENTPIFIDLPYIKSITFGLNLDGLCKRLLLEVCKEKNIECYELALNKDNFDIDRNPISMDEIAYDTDEEAAYITMLSEQIEKISQMMTSNSEKVSEAASQENFDSSAFQNMLEETEDFLCNAYFLKTSLNRVGENANEDLSQIEMPNGFISGINGINAFVIMVSQSLDQLEKTILGLNFKGTLKHDNYISSRNHIINIKELIEKINSYSWNPLFLNNDNNNAQIITHYDALIDENNDPVHDPKQLQEYMDKWDGQAFIDELQLTKDKSVMEIGVGTGRLAMKTAPQCGDFTGIDISPKTVDRAKENLAGFPNVTLIYDDFMLHKFDGQFDVIYSSLTFMHIYDKLTAINKSAELLNENGILALSVDKCQDEYIDYKSHKVHVYPDDPENICAYINAAQLKLEKKFDTELAYIFVARKVQE